MSTPAERSAAVNTAIEQIDPEWIIQIPSSTLKTIIDEQSARLGARAFPATREEEAVGIASGLVLAGRRVLLIVQDNGIGNALTALTTFPQAYHLPIVMLISRRGGLGEYNSMIHTFCEHVEKVSEAAHLRSFSLDGTVPLDEWSSRIVDAYEFAQITHRPVLVYVNLMRE
jgi:sulfopyruvate decarboxylase TPP-binding subunit